MTEQSPRMSWSYPSREDDPWYDFFRDFVIDADGSGFAHREDRSIVWSGGGTLSWDLASQTFTWTDTINIYSPMSAKLLQIAANSVANWGDGQVVYVELTRLALTNTAKTLVKANSLPSDDDVMAFAVRVGNVLYFRTGISLGDGEASPGIAPSPAAGDANAIHVNVAGEIEGIATKGTPSTSDVIVIEDFDSIAPQWQKKKIPLGNLPGISTDRFGASIIVGNEVAGDTIDSCHYLDTGNGAGIEAAIAAAAKGVDPLTDPPRDVWVRPGTYDFRNSGGPSGPIDITEGIRLRGAGEKNVTIIGKSSGDMGIFTLSDDTSLDDVLLQVPLITASGSGSRGVVAINGSGAFCHRVGVVFDGSWGSGEAALNYLYAAFYGSSTASAGKLIDCTMDLPQLSEWASPVRGAYFLEPVVSIDWVVKGMRIYGSDIGIESEVTLRVIDSEFYGFRQGGVLIDGSSFDNDCEITGNHFEIDTIPTPLSGFYGVKCVGVSRVNVSGNFFEGESSSPAGVYAINLESVVNSTINSNRGRRWASSIYLDSNSDDNIVVGNNFDGNPITNNGTGNDIAHNK